MRMAIVWVLLLGFLDSRCAHAAESNSLHPHWVIIATIIDRTTGERLKQTQLGGSDLEFDDLTKCRSVIEKVHPTTSANVTAILTCRQVSYL